MKPLFYTNNPPSWWPYEVTSINREGVSSENPLSLVLDNGAFNFYYKGDYPSEDIWLARIRRTAYSLRRRYRDAEIIVVLPDRPYDPDFTLDIARKYSKILCKNYECMVVAHYNFSKPLHMVMEEILSIDNIEYVGAPARIYCSRRGKNRRITNYACQKMIIKVIRKYAPHIKIHALSLGLKTDLLSKLNGVLHSFDTSSWTRPLTNGLPRRSAKNSAERERFFMEALRKLKDYIYIPKEVVKRIEVGL